MNQERVKKLMEFLKNEPNDPFTIYALATEYLDESPSKSKDYFEILLTEHPEYLATYYHAAQLYADLDMIEEADATYQQGITLAEKQNELKTLQELKNAYQNFEFEYL
ncbi:MAG: tetratricopeptide repeat protein [Cyclobacteriaceae bacterium]